ncbi:MAG: EscV/YscV/HrcV family type III secretion system export apparatus protein [Deltaproteobacteria bacterium]|nr:MAG: EscV/YscV/HrcV family type III secretion system export apparatus protein [Deltaproteobacteria bacterium]
MGAVFRKHADLVLAGLVVSIIGMMIVPLPTFLLDILLSLNVTLAVVLLMVSIYIGDALRIAAFPTILLVTTLFRLGLNVSTTRLILRDGYAGEVIESFGQFVVAGNIVVGAVIFLILTLIQFIVIAKGSERVAEVAARFTLDAMPGKQMSIDADLRAGNIDQAEAQRRRSALQRESQMYGSMDGAMKFVKGDAIAGILITVINIVGGLIIGVVMRGMSAGDAAAKYTVLTIGDGLVSQIPALVISLSAGMIVTRVASEDEGAHLGHDIVTQVLAQPKAIAVAAVLLALLGIIPGLPTVPFLLLSAGTGALAYSLRMREAAAGDGAAAGAPAPAVAAGRRARGGRPGAADAFAPTGIVPAAIELAPDLAAAVGATDTEGSFFTETIPQIRRALYRDLGVVLPGVRARTVPALPPNGFVVRIAELPMHQGTVRTDVCLVDEEPDRVAVLNVPAEAAPHPISGRTITAVPVAAAGVVQQAGLTAWTPAQVLAMTVASTLRKYAHEFIGIQETQALLDELEKTAPALVAEVVPKVASAHLLAEVLRRLVEEQISIRDLRAILHAMAEWAPNEKDPVILTEYVRSALARHITHEFAPDGTLVAWLIDPMIEDTIRGAIQKTATGSFLALDPQTAADILAAFRKAFASLGPDAPPPIVLTTMEVRRYVRRLIEIELPDVVVLSFQDLRPDVNIQPVGRVSP